MPAYAVRFQSGPGTDLVPGDAQGRIPSLLPLILAACQLLHLRQPQATYTMFTKPAQLNTHHLPRHSLLNTWTILLTPQQIRRYLGIPKIWPDANEHALSSSRGCGRTER